MDDGKAEVFERRSWWIVQDSNLRPWD